MIGGRCSKRRGETHTKQNDVVTLAHWCCCASQSRISTECIVISPTTPFSLPLVLRAYIACSVPIASDGDPTQQVYFWWISEQRERAESRSGIHQLGVAVVGGRAPALPTMGAEEGGMMRGFSFCKFTSTRERGKVITLCVRHCHIAATTKYTNYFCPLHENFSSKWTTKQRSGEKKWGRFFYDINIRLRHAVKGSPFGVGSKIPKKNFPILFQLLRNQINSRQ